MADDDKKPDDEYQYPPEEYYKGGEYIPPDDSEEPLEAGIATRSSFLSRRLLIIFGILFAIGIVYLVLLYANYKRSAELSQPTEAGVANIPATNMPEVQQPVTPPTQVAVPNQIDNSTLQQLVQQNQINQQNMANLQNQIQQLQNQLGSVTNSISTLNNQIQVIANELKAIATDRSLRDRNMGLTTGGTAYYLKALVPGRAWLQSKAGSTTTVTIGDRLPGYGIIQMISPEQGIVTTSSGAIIQHGPRDN